MLGVNDAKLERHAWSPLPSSEKRAQYDLFFLSCL